MNSKHLHIETIEIKQDGSILIYFEEDAHTYLTTEEVKKVLTTLYGLINANLVSFDEEE